MKKIRIFLLTIIFITTYSISIPANETAKTTIIKTFDDGSYIESASATAKKYIDGKCINTITRTVKLTCSKTGKLS